MCIRDSPCSLRPAGFPPASSGSAAGGASTRWPRDNERACSCAKASAGREWPADRSVDVLAWWLLLAGQAFVVFVLVSVRRERFLRPGARVVGFDAREPGALHALAAAVVQRLHAAFPRRPVQHQQVPLVDVAAQ